MNTAPRTLHRRQRRMLRTAIVTAGTAAVLTVGASAALAAGPTVTPNPVAPGGAITITAAAGCTPPSDWRWATSLSNSSQNPTYVPSASPAYSIAPATPGSYDVQLRRSENDGSDTTRSCTGMTSLVVAATTGVPFLDARAVVVFGALGLGAGAVAIARRRRRAQISLLTHHGAQR